MIDTRRESHAIVSGGCALCALRSRRLFTQWLAVGGGAALAGPALAQQQQQAPAEVGVINDVGRASRMAKLVPAEQIETAAAQQYQQMMREYSNQKALAPSEHPQVVRLRSIGQRLLPYTATWNDRAKQWKWEVNLLGSSDLNAFCMPGGKIAFYLGILKKLQLNDDEVAAIMGHEVAHALREHARERMGKNVATRGLIEIGSALLGLGDLGRTVAGMGAQLLTLKFSRDDETEADIVGMDLASRAGYDPAAGVTLWQKMMAASKGAPPKLLSTHPTSESRIQDIQSRLPNLAPVYAGAAKPDRRFGPPSA